MNFKSFNGIVLGLLFIANTGFAVELEFMETSRGQIKVYVPDDYDPQDPLPLIVGLHGFRQDADGLEDYWDLRFQVDSKRFIYVIPKSETNFLGQPFWNATDACCDLFGSDVDDSAFLRNLIESVQDTYAIDEFRIHIAGFSNGGFMAHRMAIDHSDILASIASQAGANFHDAQNYQPTHPVHVLQIHGTSDGTILYSGGSILGAQYPGAPQTQANWAVYNKLLTESVDMGEPIELDSLVSGNETTIEVFDPGNERGIAVELWTMAGSSHGPDFGDGSSNRFAAHVLDWLLTHPKVVTTEEVIPTELTLEQGIEVNGSLDDLAISDDNDYSFRRNISGVQARTAVIAVGTSPVLNPGTISVTYEGSVFARSGVIQTVEIFDFKQQQWIELDNRSASRFVDSVVQVEAPGDLTRFVDSGTLEVRTRIQHTASQNREHLTVNMDQIIWSISD